MKRPNNAGLNPAPQAADLPTGGQPAPSEAPRAVRSKMVLPERIELSTSPLPRECSTSELRQRLSGA